MKLRRIEIMPILNHLIHAVGRVYLVELLGRYFQSKIMAHQSSMAERTYSCIRTHKNGFNIGITLVCFPVAVINTMTKGYSQRTEFLLPCSLQSIIQGIQGWSSRLEPWCKNWSISHREILLPGFPPLPDPYFSYTAQVHLPWDATANIGLSHPTSISN